MTAGVRILDALPSDELSLDVLARVAEKHARREFVVSFDYPPIAVRDFDWSAIDVQTYDGAPDGGGLIGRGRTAEAALVDLLDQIEEREETTS